MSKRDCALGRIKMSWLPFTEAVHSLLSLPGYNNLQVKSNGFMKNQVSGLHDLNNFPK